MERDAWTSQLGQDRRPVERRVAASSFPAAPASQGPPLALAECKGVMDQMTFKVKDSEPSATGNHDSEAIR